MSTNPAPTDSAYQQALASLRHRLPEMADVAETFAMLAEAAQEITQGESPWPGYAEVDATAFSQGKPLLTDLDGKDFLHLFLDSATLMIPAIQTAFPAVAPAAKTLNAALEDRPGLAARCVGTALSTDADAMSTLAERLGVNASALTFLLQEILRPCLRRAQATLGRLANDDLWFKGYCPVCGGAPDLGFLKRKEDSSEFLISKSGRLWLHCSMCAHEWRFMRLVCPSCGHEDHDKLTVLYAEGRPEERIHACLECKSYLPVVDLSKEEVPFHQDVTPLGMTHLDILAQDRGYHPMVRRPWNSFG